MEKINLNNITFCIPVRIESFYRKRNLMILLKYLGQHIDANYIIVEADNVQRLPEIMDIANLNYIFIQDNDPIFHRTKYINQMLNLAKTPHAAIWDTDAIADIAQIQQAYDMLVENKAVMVYPFSGTFYDVNEYMSDFFCQSLDIEKLKCQGISKNLMNGYYSVGGAYMVNIKSYKEAGGENEYFYGWGPEDAERIARLQILEQKVERIDGALYHLFHTRGYNSYYANIDTAIQTREEFCKVCGMTTNELKNYIKSWEWI